MLILGTCSQCLCVLLLPKLQGRQLGYTLVFVDTHHCQPHGNFYWLLESNNRTLLLKNAWGCCLMLNGVYWYKSVPWDCLFALENRCGAKGLLLYSPALLFVRLVWSEVILLCLCYSMSLNFQAYWWVTFLSSYKRRYRELVVAEQDMLLLVFVHVVGVSVGAATLYSDNTGLVGYVVGVV